MKQPLRTASSCLRCTARQPVPPSYTERSAARRSKIRASGALLLAVVVVPVALAGCGTGTPRDAVASLSPSGSTATSGSSGRAADEGATDTEPSELAYARCMRSHGVTDFPDPDASGEIQLDAGPGSDLSPDNPTFKAADEACKPLLPEGSGEPPAGIKEANIKYAACMRENGVTDFPDPQPDGTLQLQSNPGGDLDPKNPTFKAADEACKQYLPDGGQGGSLSSVDD